MTDFQTDEEQIAALKKWWSENAKAIISGIVLGVGGLLGWNYWQSYTHDRAVASSQVYYSLESSINSNDEAAIGSSLALLEEKYSATPYLELAKLLLAKQHVEAGKLDVAEGDLQWVIDNARTDNSRDIAKLRLSEVFIANNKFDKALSLLDSGIPASYTSLIEEYRGDAYAGNGSVDKARAAYDRALISSKDRVDFLRWKRDALGEPSGAETS